MLKLSSIQMLSLGGALALGLISAVDTSAASPRQASSDVDRLIDAEIAKQASGVEAATGSRSAEIESPQTSDEDFLRRISLDLVGKIPTAHEVTLFALDPDPEKRRKLIDRLLASREFAEVWAAYWREVVYSRATDPRSRANQGVFESWLTERLDKNVSWDVVATDLITATGETETDGQTGLIFAHQGDPAEVASEVSRIFLGIQLQCANCHDHPTDKWKREQFHQLAAFFPRIQVRPQRDKGPRSFVVQSADFLERQPARTFEPEQVFRFLDRDLSGKISKAEAARGPGPLGQRYDDILKQIDKDQDGQISLAELKEAPRPDMTQPGRGSAEHYMPDLENPAEKGTVMQPVFFVNNAKLKTGTDDLDRRQSLAKFVTAKSNDWFARAFVNRVWAELLGEGFYMPVDDMGPERQPQHPQTLERLVREFQDSDYDVKGLYRTIVNTRAYQRQLARTGSVSAEAAFAAASATRLRSDQIYHSLVRVLGVEGLGAPRGAAGGAGPAERFLNRDPRVAFALIFGFDPSTPQEDVIGTIPQALFMMNSPLLNSLMRGTGDTRLARILKEYKNDEDAVIELYLQVLSREPTDRELELNLTYIKDVGARNEAFEDLLWSLVNSSEFVTKR